MLVSSLNAKFMTESESRPRSNSNVFPSEMLCHICLDSHKFILLSISFLCKSKNGDKRDRYDVCDECCVAKLSPDSYTHSTHRPSLSITINLHDEMSWTKLTTGRISTSDRSFVFLSAFPPAIDGAPRNLNARNLQETSESITIKIQNKFHFIQK